MTLPIFHFDTTYHENSGFTALGAIGLLKNMWTISTRTRIFKGSFSEMITCIPIFPMYPERQRYDKKKALKTGRLESTHSIISRMSLTSSAEGLGTQRCYGQIITGIFWGRRFLYIFRFDVFGPPPPTVANP